jgi:exopolysaccharide biosynthesis polyprenyl glycosylphosphotransferase
LSTVASSQRPVRKLLVLLDALTILAAVGVAPLEHRVLAQWLPLQALPLLGRQLAEVALVVALALPVWLSLARQLDLYALFDKAWSLRALARRVVELHVLGFVVLATLIYATQVVLNRSLVALFMLNSVVGMFVGRALVVAWTRYRYRRGLGRLRLLCVGAPGGPLGAFVGAVALEDFAPLIVGYLGPDGPKAAADAAAQATLDAPRLGSLADLDHVLHDQAIDQVLFFRPFDRADAVEQALLACETVGVPAQLAVDVGLPDGVVPRLGALYARPFVSLESSPKRPDLLAFKHLFDFCAAAIGVVLLAPLLLLVSVTIVLTMGRPIFYRQPRAGLRGRPFQMLKFRTMVPDAEQHRSALAAQNEMSGPVFKVSDDPRVTRLGRILRRTSIDELPQLLHVATGTMSLVGPRPLPLDEQQQIHGWHRRRLAMRPGITGLWQTSGRSDTTFERWMELDLQYVDQWSLWLDLKILLRTVPVVLLQRGAR